MRLKTIIEFDVFINKDLDQSTLSILIKNSLESLNDSELINYCQVKNIDSNISEY